MKTSEIYIQQIKLSIDNLEQIRLLLENRIIAASYSAFDGEVAKCKPQIDRIDKRIDELQERIKSFLTLEG